MSPHCTVKKNIVSYQTPHSVAAAGSLALSCVRALTPMAVRVCGVAEAVLRATWRAGATGVRASRHDIDTSGTRSLARDLRSLDGEGHCE